MNNDETNSLACSVASTYANGMVEPAAFAHALIPALLARLAQDTEPVAWIHPCYLEADSLGMQVSPVPLGPRQVPLFLHPPTQQVPEGWVLVPKEPTDEMLDRVIDERLAALHAGEDHNLIDIYKAMIAAAPKEESK